MQFEDTTKLTWHSDTNSEHSECECGGAQAPRGGARECARSPGAPGLDPPLAGEREQPPVGPKGHGGSVPKMAISKKPCYQNAVRVKTDKPGA